MPALGALTLALAVVCCTMAAFVLLDHARLRRRSTGVFDELGPGAEVQVAAPAANRASRHSLLWQLGEPLVRWVPATRRAELEGLLRRAGVASSLGLPELTGPRALTTLGGIVLGACLIVVIGPFAVLSAVSGGLVGHSVPVMVLNRRARRRREAVEEALPSTLDILVVSLDAGLAFDTSVAYMCQRLDNPATAQFRLFLADMRLGRSRREALARMVERTQSDLMRRVSNEVLQADTLGVGLARALRTQVNLMRTERRHAADEQARQVPIKLLLPMTAFILPVLFIVLLAPALLSVLGMDR
jgi:tight adherence protein C